MIIYKLTTPDSKCWIGQSITTLEKRLKQHHQLWRKLKRRNQSYHGSCAKLFCGFDDFDPNIDGNWVTEVIDHPTTRKEMDDLEIHYIKYFDSINNGYNITPGGKGLKKEFLDIAHKQNISVSRTEWFQTQEGLNWKEELSINYTGNNNPMFGKTHNSYERTTEWRTNHSEKMKGKIPWNKGKTGVYSEQVIETNKQKAIQRHEEGFYDYSAMAEMRKGFKQPQSQKDGVAKALAKEYEFLNPQGQYIHIINLHKFCKENGLNQGNMLRVHQSIYKSCKGWTKYK